VGCANPGNAQAICFLFFLDLTTTSLVDFLLLLLLFFRCKILAQFKEKKVKEDEKRGMSKEEGQEGNRCRFSCF